MRDTAVVDLACGTGSAALVAPGAGARVTAVDLTAELIAIAAERPGADAVRWLVAEAAHTGRPDGGFAAVVSNMGNIFRRTQRLVRRGRPAAPGADFAFSAWVPDE